MSTFRNITHHLRFYDIILLRASPPEHWRKMHAFASCMFAGRNSAVDDRVVRGSGNKYWSKCLNRSQTCAKEVLSLDVSTFDVAASLRPPMLRYPGVPDTLAASGTQVFTLQTNHVLFQAILKWFYWFESIATVGNVREWNAHSSTAIKTVNKTAFTEMKFSSSDCMWRHL